MKSTVSRRRFMTLLGATTALSTASLFSVNTIFANSSFLSKETQMLLGTIVTITIEDSSDSLRQKALLSAFNHIKELESQLSRYNASSALFALNRDGILRNTPSALATLITESKIHEDNSKGSFNITVAPLLDYIKNSKNKNNFQSSLYQEAIAKVASAKSVVIEKDVISFTEKDMSITLDGIAKGYIVDSVADILTSLDIERYCINAGGDIRVGGSALVKNEWSIGIQSPFSKNTVLSSVKLKEGAIATSGVYEQYYSKDKKMNHLIVPQLGLSSTIQSVTVKAPTAMLADALSTALSTMSVKDALQYANKYDKVDCLIIDNNRVYKSKLWNNV